LITEVRTSSITIDDLKPPGRLGYLEVVGGLDAGVILKPSHPSVAPRLVAFQ
jgi:hypothetical protein